MKSIVGLRPRRMAVAALAIFAVAGGIGYASIPDSAGVVHGCYRTSTDDQKGQLRVVDDPASCRSNELPIEWNQAGSPGAPGQDGTDGVSPTVQQLAAGDSNCPAGGAAITDVAGTTAYVCSGQAGAPGTPFAGTFTSPNGQYSISVTDAGVTILSPDSSISVSGTQIRVDSMGSDDIVLRGADDLELHSGDLLELRSGSGLELRSGTTATVQSAAGLDLRAGSTATLQSGAGLALRGSSVGINAGTSCPPAARVGDLVDVGAGKIVSGSGSVCIG